MCLSRQLRLLPSLSPFPPFILPETPEARDERDLGGFPSRERASVRSQDQQGRFLTEGGTGTPEPPAPALGLGPCRP